MLPGFRSTLDLVHDEVNQSSHTHLVHDLFRGVILKLFASVHLALQPSNIWQEIPF